MIRFSTSSSVLMPSCSGPQFTCSNTFDQFKIRISATYYLPLMSGAQPRLKSWGGPRFGSQHRGACPAPGQRPGWVLGAGGAPLPLWGSGGMIPGKFLKTQMHQILTCILVTTCSEISCILVTTCSEISCFLKTTAKKLGTNTLLVPQPKSWGTSLPRSLRLLRIWLMLMPRIHLAAVGTCLSFNNGLINQHFSCTDQSYLLLSLW